MTKNTEAAELRAQVAQLENIVVAQTVTIAELRAAKCDGNHGGPRCTDPECWNDSPQAAEPVAWPTMPPSRGQSPVIFEDGYTEGWAKCLDACKAAIASPQPAEPAMDTTHPAIGAMLNLDPFIATLLKRLGSGACCAGLDGDQTHYHSTTQVVLRAIDAFEAKVKRAAEPVKGEPCYGVFRQRNDENGGKEYLNYAIHHGQTALSDGERMVKGVFIPQASDPAIKESLTVAEPVKVLRETEALKIIGYYADLRIMASQGRVSRLEVHDAWEEIKALLARYGSKS